MAYEGTLSERRPEVRATLEGAWDRHAAQHLASASSSGREAREFVQQMLSRWGWPCAEQVTLGGVQELQEFQELQDVLLLTSELAINAAEHARTPMDVIVHYWPGARIRVEVHDGAEGLPRARWPATFEESGRGLALVELLSSRWGVTDCPTGKTVWFELQLR